MSRFYWALLAVNAVVAALLFFALPFGPDLVYLVLAGSQVGMFAALGREASQIRALPPPSHPVWRNPRL